MTRSQLLEGLAKGWQIIYQPEPSVFLVMPANTEKQCHNWLAAELKMFGCPVRISAQCFPKPPPPLWETVIRLSNEGMKDKEIAVAINRSRSRVPVLREKALRHQRYLQAHNIN